MRRLAGLLLAVVTLTAVLPGARTADAHAALRTSDPGANAFLQRPPARVTLTFTEPIDSRSSTIEILDGLGKRIILPEPIVSGVTMSVELPELGPGIYNVLWSNVSRVDGHAIRGMFPFTVLEADGSMPAMTNLLGGTATSSDPPPREDGIAVRALSLLGLVMIMAWTAITILWHEAPATVRRALFAAAIAGVTVVLFATLLNLATVRDAYGSIALSELLWHTPSGRYWLLRLAAVVGAACAIGLARTRPRPAGLAALGAVAIYLWGYTATSHAAAVPGSGWARGLDFVHGMAALAWVGALTGLAVATRAGSRDDRWRHLMPRFSTTASVGVFLVLSTGFFSALVEVDRLSKLTETRYGLVLLAKLALAMPLLLVAAYNARRGKAALVSARPGQLRRFQLLVTLEAALGLAVVFGGAVLTQTTASRSIVISPSSRPFDQATAVAGLQVRLGIDPNQTGLNTYRVELFSDSRAEPVEATRVRLTFRYQEDQAVGPSSLTLTRAEPGVYLGQGPFMTLEGRWRVEAEVRREGLDDAVAFFEVRPAGIPVAGLVSTGTWVKPTPGLTWNQFGGLLLVIVGLGFTLYRRPLAQVGREAQLVANGLAFAGFGAGFLLLFAVHNHEMDADLPTNPVFPDANSIAAGRRLYDQNCISCHGRTGVPPAGLQLNPYPLDLTVHVPQHPDGQLYNFIANGVPGSAMVAWKDAGLTEEQIWHLVNYLRTFSPVDQ